MIFEIKAETLIKSGLENEDYEYVKSFKSADHAKKWLDDEFIRLNWVREISNLELEQEIPNSEDRKWYERIRQFLIQQIRSQIDTARENVKKDIATSVWNFHSDSMTMAIVSEFRAEGETKALAVLFYIFCPDVGKFIEDELKKYPNNLENAPVASKFSAMLQIYFGEFSKILLKKNLQKIAGDVSNFKEQILDDVSKFKEQILDDVSKFKKGLAEQQVNKTMQEYWSNKAIEHKTHKKFWLKRFYLTLGSWLCFLLMGGLILPFIGGLTENLHWVPILLLISMICLWISRICLRNNMSHTHLEEDANQRCVMIQTFGALAYQTKDNMLEEHKTILLNNIFRPAADGIVKDDLLPLELLAQYRKK